MNAIAARRSILAEAARLAEERAEALAPAIVRKPVVDRDGAVLRGPRVESARWRDPEDNNPQARAPREIAGFRVVDTMQRLYLAERITKDELDHAATLIKHYEIGHEGAQPGSSRRVEGGRTASPQFGPSAAQLDALARYRAAVQAVGQRLCAVLLPVALCNAEAGDVPALRRALAALAAHYGDNPDWDEDLS